MKKKLAELGLVTTGSTPAAFLERVRAETERWSRVVKENDIKVEGQDDEGPQLRNDSVRSSVQKAATAPMA